MDYIEIQSEDSIREMLEEAKEEKLIEFTQEKRKKVTESSLMSRYVNSVKRLKEELSEKNTENIPFSVFKLYDETGNRSIFENCYFVRRRKLVCYAISVLLYEKEEDISKLEDIIWAICDEYSWCLGAHYDGLALKKLQYENFFSIDLFAAETACALCEAIYFCGKYIHGIVAERAMRLATDRVLKMYMNNKYAWEGYRSNWAAVCGGNVGMAAIYAEKAGYLTGDELANIIFRTQFTMNRFLEGFPEDGTCGEGIGYWTYGFGYFVIYADLLKRRTGGKTDYFTLPHVKTIGEFNQKVRFPSGRTVSFSDGSSDENFSYGLISYLADTYDNISVPSVEFSEECCTDSCGRFARELRNLLWGRTEEKKSGNKSRIYLLHCPSWYIGTSDDDVINLAAKGGRNDEQHNHNDIGSFEIFKNGEEIFADIGSGEYTREYFSSDRYNVFCCCSRGHSVPIIGGKYQKPGGRNRASDVELTESGLAMDIKGAYDNRNIKYLGRNFEFDRKNGKVTVDESFEFENEPETFRERFISYGEPMFEEGRVTVFSKDGRESLNLFYPKDKFKASLYVEKINCHSGKGTNIYCIDLDYTGKNNMKDSFRFTIG